MPVIVTISPNPPTPPWRTAMPTMGLVGEALVMAAASDGRCTKKSVLANWKVPLEPVGSPAKITRLVKMNCGCTPAAFTRGKV